jgi:hypothetical protein
MTLIASIIWVGVGIYTATTKSSLTEVDTTVLEPISPTLDQEVIRALSERLKIEVELTAPEKITSEIATESASIEEEGALR